MLEIAFDERKYPLFRIQFLWFVLLRYVLGFADYFTQRTVFKRHSSWTTTNSVWMTLLHWLICRADFYGWTKDRDETQHATLRTGNFSLVHADAGLDSQVTQLVIWLRCFRSYPIILLYAKFSSVHGFVVSLNQARVCRSRAVHMLRA